MGRDILSLATGCEVKQINIDGAETFFPSDDTRDGKMRQLAIGSPRKQNNGGKCSVDILPAVESFSERCNQKKAAPLKKTKRVQAKVGKLSVNAVSDCREPAGEHNLIICMNGSALPPSPVNLQCWRCSGHRNRVVSQTGKHSFLADPYFGSRSPGRLCRQSG